MGALATAVHSGKALYVGISSYGPQRTREAAAILRALKVPLLIHQPSYSLLNRWVEKELLGTLQQERIGCIAFSPLAQGLLSANTCKASPPTRAPPQTLTQAIDAERAEPCTGPCVGRHRPPARPKPGAVGYRLGAQKASDHQRLDRREPLGTVRESAWQRCGRSRCRWRS